MINFEVLKEKCSKLGIGFIDEIDALNIDRALAFSYPSGLIKKHKIIPYEKANECIFWLVANPLDSRVVSVISSISQDGFKLVLAKSEQIERYIETVYSEHATEAAISELNSIKSDSESALAEGLLAGADASSNPAVRLVDSIIKEAILERASDVHIEPFEKSVKVRFRIDGDLRHRAEFAREAYAAVATRIKIMSGLNIAQRRNAQDGRIDMRVGGIDYDLRISTLPTVFGEKFAIRILDKSSFNLSRQDVGFDEEENALIDKMLLHPHGIILLTGPTGCGKSTTLYSFLREVNNPKVNIVTVEDPVEYTMEGVNQTQVNTKANLTFAGALRAILRQDPDVIMIGEIRDEETASIAVRAAITGHLVFSTLHTNDAPGAIVRLQDMGVPDYLISDATVGIIAQRLVKKLCPACKEKHISTESEIKLLKIRTPTEIYTPKGCGYCGFSGYKGRCAVHEILYVDDKLKSAILTEKSIDALRKIAIDGGMTPLEDACKKLVLKGETSTEELINLGLN